MAKSAAASAARATSGPGWGLSCGSLKVPRTSRGTLRLTGLTSLGRGLSTRSSSSFRRLIEPSPRMTVSVVSKARARVRATPSSTPKSPYAQLTTGEAELEGLELQYTGLESHVCMERIDRKSLRLDPGRAELHVGIQRPQLPEIVGLVRQHAGLLRTSACLGLLPGVGGFARAGRGKGTDDHREVVEIEVVGEEIGARMDPRTPGYDTQIAAKVAVADRALESAITDDATVTGQRAPQDVGGRLGHRQRAVQVSPRRTRLGFRIDPVRSTVLTEIDSEVTADGDRGAGCECKRPTSLVAYHFDRVGRNLSGLRLQ